MANIIFDLGFIPFVVAFYLYLKRRRVAARLPLPPGPRKLPIIGNLLDIPKGFEWMTYHKWCKKLGSDIIHFDIVGTSIIVLNNAQMAVDLLEKRSSIYSNRMRMPMINELMGWDFNVAWMPYGEYWRQHRRLLHQELNATAAIHFRPYELKATHGLLRALLTSPDDLDSNLRQMAGETIMGWTYGLEIQPKNDIYVDTAAKGVRPLFEAAIPGAFLVDSVPILKKVPDWMPFAGFKRKARHWRKLALDMVDIPYKAVKHNIENGDAAPSFALRSLRNMDESRDIELQEYIIKSTAGTMYTAGSDTTVSAIGSCILGLLENPAVLKKAQEELDRVIGPNQLPTFDDEDSLPYITAITKETLRWREITPIAIPHLLDVDDEYMGYRLPKGSVIVPNAWAMLHDEKVYPQPFEFNPDRFIKDGKLDPEVRDPMHAAFGFGRRICPGRHMAFSAVWIAIASILTVFDITKARDKDGNIIEPSHEYMSAIVCLPVPFKCSITPRSKQAEALIRATINGEYF